MPILVVEDEAAIAESVLAALELERFHAVHAGTLTEARQLLEARAIELVVLDVGLPDGSGFELCRELRARTDGGPPVVFLTARSEVTDRIVGLELGGDDYLPKPFSPRELVARIKAVLRRGNGAGGNQGSDPGNGSGKATGSADLSGVLLHHDERRCKVLARGTPLDLSRNEYRLLTYLMAHPGRVFSRTQLLEGCWEDPWASGERTVDAHIKAVRAKLREVLDKEEVIETHRGLGYSLVE